MRDEHYLLRQTKSLRNACAHSSNIFNGFTKCDGDVATNARVSTALAEAGISRRVRAAKMRNPRLKQIATVLYLHSQIVPEGTSRELACESLMRLRHEMHSVIEELPNNDAVRSSFGFLITLVDTWF